MGVEPLKRLWLKWKTSFPASDRGLGGGVLSSAVLLYLWCHCYYYYYYYYLVLLVWDLRLIELPLITPPPPYSLKKWTKRRLKRGQRLVISQHKIRKRGGGGGDVRQSGWEKNKKFAPFVHAFLWHHPHIIPQDPRSRPSRCWNHATQIWSIPHGGREKPRGGGGVHCISYILYH